MKNLILTLTAMVLAISVASAQEWICGANGLTAARKGALESEVRRPFLLDSLRTCLDAASTPADSLSPLLDIYDLSVSDKNDRLRIAKEIYGVASRARDTLTMLESLSYRANAALHDSAAMTEVRKELGRIRKSTPRIDEARLFVDMLTIRNRSLSGEKISRQDISKFINLATSDEEMSDYNRALLLFTICVGLGDQTRGPLLEEYYERLISLLESMNLPMGSVRNMVYNYASTAFSTNEMWPRAIEINKKLLNIVDSLSDSYAHRGRKFRKYDRYRYMYYRRMLVNNRGLTLPEIESFHREIQRIAATDAEVCDDMERNPTAEAFYLAASGKYAEAIPLLKKAADIPGNKRILYPIYTAMYDAALNCGDIHTQLKAATALNKILREAADVSSDERHRELRIIYDANDLRGRNVELETKRRRSEINNSRIVIGISLAAIILLFVLIIILWKRNKKMRSLSAELTDAAAKLRAERNDLRKAKEELTEARDQATSADKIKAEFIDNITHELKTPLAAVSEYSRLIVDCIPEEQNKYLRKFADIIELNTKLMSTLVDDLLDAASLEHGSMNVTYDSCSVYQICSVAMGNLFEMMSSPNQAVELLFNPDNKPDVNIRTDRQRVVQVLVNLLSNAEKFTEKGKIILDFSIDGDARMITFSVTDTGCGIAPGNEEKIFERFMRANQASSGIGLGLYISRLLADLLGGTISLDPSYRRGARFLFTIPM